MPHSLNDSSLLTPPTRFVGELPKTSDAVDRKWQTQNRLHFKRLRGSAASYRAWPPSAGPLRSSAKLPNSPDLSPAFRADFQLALRGQPHSTSSSALSARHSQTARQTRNTTD